MLHGQLERVLISALTINVLPYHVLIQSAEESCGLEGAPARSVLKGGKIFISLSQAYLCDQFGHIINLISLEPYFLHHGLPLQVNLPP